MLFFYKSFKSLFGELGKFIEQGRFDFLEVETGFSLHVFLEFGGNIFKQVRVHVNGHEIKRDVILLDLRRAEEDILFPFLAVGAFKIVGIVCICFQDQL